MTWSNSTSFAQVCHRAGGRRGYNSKRRLQRELRQAQVLELMRRWGWTGGTRSGLQRRLAKHLNVSEATISRDIWKLIKADQHVV